MLTQEAAELLAGLASEVNNADEIPINNDLPFPDYGQLSAFSWKSYIFKFKSAKIYVARIEDFFLYLRHTGKEGIQDQQALEEALVEYFDYNHQLVDEDGNPKYKGSQFRGWFSMFIAFWKHTKRGDLKINFPILLDNLKKWEKELVTVKAKTFTEDNLGMSSFIFIFVYFFDVITILYV